MADLMHAGDLGVLSYELGEVLWTILPQLGAGPGRSRGAARAAGLQVFKTRLKAFYKERRTDSRLPLKRFSLRKVKAH